MDKKQAIDYIRQALDTGVVTPDDLQQLIGNNQPTVIRHNQPSAAKSHLSAVEIVFYIAGLILFAAIMSVVAQVWSDGIITRLVLCLGVGLALWGLVYMLSRRQTTDIEEGIKNAALLTGSLLICSGAVFVGTELFGIDQIPGYIIAAAVLFVLSLVHIIYDRMVKHDLLLMTAILLGVAVFPVIVNGLLLEFMTNFILFKLVIIGSALLLMATTRFVKKYNPERKVSASIFDNLSVLIILITLYILTFDEIGLLWLFVLIIVIIGIYYMSIARHNQQFLAIATIFLVVTITTISFRYFSGFGVTTSLIISAVGLLATGAVASNINKRYFDKNLPTN